MRDPAGDARSLGGAASPFDPDAVIDRQLAAYNANDIEAFLAAYAPDAEVFRPLAPDAPVLIGRDAIRGAYGPRFAAVPGVHADILARVVDGDLVTDHEHMTLTGTRANVIYQVCGLAIRRVWIYGPLPGDVPATPA